MNRESVCWQVNCWLWRPFGLRFACQRRIGSLRTNNSNRKDGKARISRQSNLGFALGWDKSKLVVILCMGLGPCPTVLGSVMNFTVAIITAVPRSCVASTTSMDMFRVNQPI